MVVHSNVVAMMELYYAIPGAQLPWKLAKWIDNTGLQGLFGEGPGEAPSHWSPDDRAAVKTFFEAYNSKPTVEAKLSFASARSRDDYKGRGLWRDFITKSWKKWKVQSTIFAAFETKCVLYTQVMVANDMDDVPETIAYSDAFDLIAFSLFGPEVLDSNGKVKFAIRRPISALAVNASKNLRKVTRSLVIRLSIRKKEIESLLQVLGSSSAGATIGSVKDLTKLVGGFKEDTRLLPLEKNLAALKNFEEELAGIMVSLGGTIEYGLPVSKKPAQKAIQRNTKALAQKDQAAAAEALKLLVTVLADDEDIPELHPLLSIDFGGLEEGLDPGVAFESTKTPEELCTHLGISCDGRTPIFNTHRHTGAARTTPASDPKLFKDFIELGHKHPEAHLFSPIALLPHQIQGIHSALRQFFTPEPSPDNPCGVLIADAPGLGKTAMSLAIVVYIILVGIRQEGRTAQPALIAARPFLGIHSVVPNLPSIIIAPGTLTGQWWQEHNTFIKPDVIATFIYPTSKPARAKFFAAGGPFDTCPVPLRNRIIIVTHSTLFTEYRDLYEQPGANEKHDFTWTIPSKKMLYDSKVSKTLFGRQYLTAIIDEAHFCRNPGSTHLAPLALLQQCTARLVLTATPVQTRIEDVGAMGRLANIAYFSSQVFADQISTDAADIRRARIDDPSSVRSLQVAASRRMQLQFCGAMICRSVDSKDYFGKPLLVLPRKDTYFVHLQLQQWELQFVDQSLTEESFEQMAMAKIQGIQTESLYSNERLMVTFPREDRKKPIPSFKSKRQWKDAGSPTKITAVKDLAKYLLLGDDVPPPIVSETGISYPVYTPSATTTKKRKILIYQEFPIYTEPLRDVLGIYGVFSLSLNGALNYPARDRVVAEFKISEKYRVLIISKVGAFGLNLTCADTLIFLDQQWSYADENQAIGRIYRQGQLRPVSIYHMLAVGTVDYYMSRLAQGKAVISKAFLTTERQKKLGRILMDDDTGLGDSEAEDEEAPQSTKEKRKAEKKARKEARREAKKAKALPEPEANGESEDKAGPPALVDQGDESDSDQGAQAPSKPMPKPKKKGKKSRKVVSEEVVEDSEPERKKGHGRAPNRKVNLDSLGIDTPPSPAGDADVDMGGLSDSEGGISYASAPPLSSRSSSKAHSGAASDASMAPPGRKKPSGLPEAVSAYSSSSDSETLFVPPKKRDRSHSVQQGAAAVHAAAAPPKRSKHQAEQIPLSPDPSDAFFEDFEDVEDFEERGLVATQLVAHWHPSQMLDALDDHPPDQPPYTQRMPSYAAKSPAMLQAGTLASNELMRRRMPGGSNPHIPFKNSAPAVNPPAGGSRAPLSGITKRTGPMEPRPTIPKLGNPFGRKSRK